MPPTSTCARIEWCTLAEWVLDLEKEANRILVLLSFNSNAELDVLRLLLFSDLLCRSSSWKMIATVARKLIFDISSGYLGIEFPWQTWIFTYRVITEAFEAWSYRPCWRLALILRRWAHVDSWSWATKVFWIGLDWDEAVQFWRCSIEKELKYNRSTQSSKYLEISTFATTRLIAWSFRQ